MRFESSATSSARTPLSVPAQGVLWGLLGVTAFSFTVPFTRLAVEGLAPLFIASVLRTGDRPPRAFWALAVLGLLAAVGFALLQAGGFGGLHLADLLLFGAVIAAAFGYAEGGLLARELGAWQTVSWALLGSAPVMVVLTGLAVRAEPPTASPLEWAAFGYLGVVSMYLGFFAWYRGLGIGPMAQVSQVQLVQPVMSIAWAALLLGEDLTWQVAAGAVAVMACAALAVRTRLAG